MGFEMLNYPNHRRVQSVPHIEQTHLETPEKPGRWCELRNPILVFHILPNIGYFIFFIGLVLKISTLKYIAFLLMGIVWIIDGAEIWITDSKRGLILVLLGFITFLATTFLALKFLFNFSLL